MWTTHALPILSNKSLILRKLQTEDTPRLVELAQDPAMRDFTTIPSPFPVENALEFISSSSVPTDSLIRWAIAAADKPSTHLGTIEMHVQSPICVDIGYSLHPHARGLGIMPKAVGASKRLRIVRRISPRRNQDTYHKHCFSTYH
ncbi:GNAT family N-acetyltransferase [Corynebacterium rouxii]|uniref:GNAT family N-acetyltransferase n=1 Tax=Corynebacterium rouxii TaxID=2719119 RepID=A0ABU3PPF3_9CORY|nr:GNAT family N-acetyltransferase [Corynebacterium rouxii]MDT9409418.1 GNAT family N-acetyltransferase [Corynebacterium rouxii]MDT9411651.1 GNAT family N-acetyltransferase [Corynebacterium rouxii]